MASKDGMADGISRKRKLIFFLWPQLIIGDACSCFYQSFGDNLTKNMQHSPNL